MTPALLHSPADFGPAPPNDSRGASLLIVDDSPTQAEQLRAVLEMHGYQVTVAHNGAEALVALRQNPPQLVLTDIVMPEMDGYELCRRIKAEAAFQNLPVILLTSLADSQDVLAGLACGADCFITKPFNDDYLIAKLPQLLSRRDSGRDAAPRVAVEIRLGDQPQLIQAAPQQMLTLLLSTYEAAVAKNAELSRAQEELRGLTERLESLVAERTAALSAEAAERQRAHEALQKSEQNFRGSLERSLDGIMVVDGAGGIVFVNPAAAKLFDQAPAELLGSPFLHDIVPEQNTELEITNSPGKTLVVEMRMARTQWHGQPASLVSLRDVTHRKRNEQQLRIAGEELKCLNKRLMARNSEIQKFYHTLSHELKTPLTSAREFISILLEGLGGPLNETQLEYLKIAMESCDQLRLFINDLLDVTRLETGKMSLGTTPGSLATTVETVVKMLSPAAKGKGVRLTADCQPDLPDLPFDKHRIMQVLTNLITNAIKFTPAGGEIHVSLGEVAADPKHLQVSVRDTGCGIPTAQLGLIFNRLHQAHREDVSAESRSGLGLGLYICQELVQLHGGRIWAESQLGQGSTFSFKIPKRQTMLSQTLLVVDDEAPIRRVLRFVFEKAGYQVVLASGGAEALELMRKQLPALVILDLLMPDMNGAETLLRIREEWQALPVILHTAYLEGDLMNQALKGAPFTVVAKPALPEQFLKTIRDLIGTNPGTIRRPPTKPTS